MGQVLTNRFIGHAVSEDNRHCRAIHRMVVHGSPIGFRALCEQVVTPTTRYLVFDLDRTLHLLRNMGELFGWEMSAYHAYGPDYLQATEASRKTSRFVLDPSRPRSLSRYLSRGARSWAYPGLYYLWWGKLAERMSATQRWQYQQFGAFPHLTVQTTPAIALLHDVAGLSLDTLRDLASNVFARYERDLVVTREDIQWLRQRSPGIRIILSSASPQPVVEAAARALGIDDVDFTEIEVCEGTVSAPYQIDRPYLKDKRPRRISPPSRFVPNGGSAKIKRLLARYPDVLEPGVETVGITDTWYGDDHCWAQYFTRVVDVNSTAPFHPLVAFDSPLQEVHSARVLSVREQQRRADGDSDYLDPRRERWGLGHGRFRDFDATEVGAILAVARRAVEAHASQYREVEQRLNARGSTLESEIAAARLAVEDAVQAYNQAPSHNRSRHRRQLRRSLVAQRRLERRHARVQRPLSSVALSIEHLLRRSRELFDVAVTTAAREPIVKSRMSVSVAAHE